MDHTNHDLNGVSQVMSENVVWTARSGHSSAGVRRGLPEVLALFDTMGAIMGKSNVRVNKLVVGANDDYVVECQHISTNREDGNNLDHVESVLWRFANGKIAEGTHFFADPEQVNKFFTHVAG